jgi:nucleotide sugar dehydrogenase
VIGLGVIGQAQVRLFDGHDVIGFDPKYGTDYPYDALTACDFAVICVGTPADDDGSANLDYVADAWTMLPPGLPVLIRSTVPPGTSEWLRGDYETHVCHCPEFMGENPLHPWQESADVPFLILGGDEASRDFFRLRLAQVHPGPIHECASRESEMVKYVANAYWASRVTFVNEIALVCDHLDVDFERVREAWLNDPRVDGAYTRREGLPPGFGGSCLPKDLSALISASLDAGYDPLFLGEVDDANDRFRA